VRRGINLLFLGPRHSRMGWEGQPHVPAASTPGKDPVLRHRQRLKLRAATQETSVRGILS